MTNIFIKTYGCTHNISDSEFMAGLLFKDGFEIVDSVKKSDIIVINTCTVKDPSEKKFYSELKRIDKPVIVAGCIPQSDPDNPLLKHCSLIGVRQIFRIVDVVEKTLSGERVVFLDDGFFSLDMPRLRKNSLVGIIPLSNGCLGSCTYCKTRQARGCLSSFNLSDIVARLKRDLDDGVKEFWLTSEDTGAYGFDIGLSLPVLLNELLKVKGDFRIRLGMINPQHVKFFLGDLIKIFQDDRMFKFIHIPLQSGSNKVLNDMNRFYSVEDFEFVVQVLRQNIPGITIATDIICGFPSESSIDFKKTLNLISRLKPEVLNISKFYPRPNTKAALLKLLPTKIVKERSKKLHDLNESLIPNVELAGSSLFVFFDEKGKHNTFIGRTDSYRQVVVKGNDLLGKRLKVKIQKVFRNYSKGVLI